MLAVSHRRLFSFILMAVLITVVGPVTPAADLVQIGIVVDGDWIRNDEIRRIFEEEITDLLKSEFEVRFPPARSLNGGWTRDGVHAALDTLFADDGIDIILAMGVLASHDAASRDQIPKPVLAPFVIDRVIQGLPYKDGASGKPNLSYTTFPHSVEADLTAFREITPFQRVAFLINQRIAESTPRLTEHCYQAGEELGIEVVVYEVDRSGVVVAESLPDDIEAVYLAPLIHLGAEDYRQTIETLNARKLPTFSLLGRWEVERGVLASLNQDSNFRRLARRIALNIQRILLGEQAADLSVSISRDEELTINMATARTIEVYPPWKVITEATLIQDIRTEVDRHITLSDAINEALMVNRSLVAAELDVTAGEHAVDAARGNLLPQLDASALGRMIDEDRAAAGFGSAPERAITGSVSGTQVIFSESAWANWSIQKRLQDARVYEHDRVALDVASEAATAYLNLLRAKSSEEVQKDNLKLTRSNLKLAQVREAIGISGRAEVYRWESQIARGRQDVIRANSQRNLAEIALNRTLHRPLEEHFTISDAGLDDPSLLTAGGRLLGYIGDPWSFKVFRRFVVAEGIAAAPELNQLDAAIAAQRRALTSARFRAFSLPTIALRGDVTHQFYEGGAGTEGFQLDVPGVTLPEFPEADDNDWSIGISVTLPLFSGGTRYAEWKQSQAVLRRLEADREDAAEHIEQRIRSALHRFGASYAAIALSEDAATAARQNLDLVTDAYARGVVSIIDLLDAQNASLVADEVAAGAVYSFLIDLVEVERASGQLVLLTDPSARDTWFARLDRFFAESGIAPPR